MKIGVKKKDKEWYLAILFQLNVHGTNDLKNPGFSPIMMYDGRWKKLFF